MSDTTAITRNWNGRMSLRSPREPIVADGVQGNGAIFGVLKLASALSRRAGRDRWEAARSAGVETLPNVSPKRRIVAPAATQRKQACALQIGSAEYRCDGEGSRVMKVVGSQTVPGRRDDRRPRLSPRGPASDQ